MKKLLAVLLFLSTPAMAEMAVAPAEVSLDEYASVPEGLLLPKDQQVMTKSDAPTTTATPLQAMTMEDILKAYANKDYAAIAPNIQSLADKDYPQAAEILGIMYRYGQGVAKDPARAEQYLLKAADANRPIAQHHLGIMYYLGEGGQKDMAKALMWLQIAIVHYPEGADRARAVKDRDNMRAATSRRDQDRAHDLAFEWLAKRNEGHLLTAE